MKSKFGTLNKRDFVRGLIFAVLTAMFGVVYGVIMPGDFDFTWIFWQPILITAAKSGIQAFFGYIMLNVFSNSQGDPLKGEK
jgi:hypothetical protein